MKTLVLIAKTRKGANRIRQWGAEWLVIEERDHVHILKGPGIAIRPADGNPMGDRWIAKNDDPDFHWEEKLDG